MTDDSVEQNQKAQIERKKQALLEHRAKRTALEYQNE